MSILNTVFGGEIPTPTDNSPLFEQNKKYRLCTEDNPNENKYRCGKRDIIRPDCKLSLYLEELTSEELKTIEIELLNLLERNGFSLR